MKYVPKSMYPLTHIFLSIMHSSACSLAVSVCAGAFIPLVKPLCEPGTVCAAALSYSGSSMRISPFIDCGCTQRSRLLSSSFGSSPGFIAIIAIQSFHTLGYCSSRTISCSSLQYSLCTPLGESRIRYPSSLSLPMAFPFLNFLIAASHADHVNALATSRPVPSTPGGWASALAGFVIARSASTAAMSASLRALISFPLLAAALRTSSPRTTCLSQTCSPVV